MIITLTEAGNETEVSLDEHKIYQMMRDEQIRKIPLAELEQRLRIHHWGEIFGRNKELKQLRKTPVNNALEFRVWESKWQPVVDRLIAENPYKEQPGIRRLLEALSPGRIISVYEGWPGGRGSLESMNKIFYSGGMYFSIEPLLIPPWGLGDYLRPQTAAIPSLVTRISARGGQYCYRWQNLSLFRFSTEQIVQGNVELGTWVPEVNIVGVPVYRSSNHAWINLSPGTSKLKHFAELQRRINQ